MNVMLTWVQYPGLEQMYVKSWNGRQRLLSGGAQVVESPLQSGLLDSFTGCFSRNSGDVAFFTRHLDQEKFSVHFCSAAGFFPLSFYVALFVCCGGVTLAVYLFIYAAAACAVQLLL